MPDYKAMYYHLPRTQARVVDILQQAHQCTEELYLQSEEALHLAGKKPTDEEEESAPAVNVGNAPRHSPQKP